MALFHLSVTQTKRSAGQSAIASAAYRAGERLYSEYYGEYSDYTRKGGVICSDILLPSHAPPEYADRQTLWNAVEKAERGKTAQLAYSFDIALQNEFSLEENIALARQFLLEQFVSRGMVVDFAVHQPDREDGGIPNPHFHVLCPIRPIEQNGKWGCKQHRVYELDEDGNRIRDADGNFVFNAVPTTDWGSPETLEYWRQTWAELCNAKFAEKGLDVSIDHRSYERQGVELLPTVHEGATVRAMEKKGIRTEKGEFNRWIKATNAVIRDIKKKIALLFDWIAEAKVELAKPQAPDLVSLLNAYYTQRRAGAYSQKGMRETATSSLSLKHRLTFCPLSAFIRRTGRQGATLPWAAFQAKPLTVFFLNARTSEKCSSALSATPQEVKPAPGWHRTFPARSPSFALSRYDLTATVRAFKASQAMGRAAREPCGGETPLELRQQPSVLSFPFVVISFPMKGGFVSMETTMKKTTSPIVREYKIGDITYIVKAVVKDGAKEDAVTKVRRLIQNDLRGKKVTNNFEPA